MGQATIPYGRQSIDEDDIDAVVAVLRSDFLTQGPTVPAFEKAVASRTGAKHGIAVNSATSALHIACLALGIGPGDIVWTSPITFVASANCALYCGASVDFVDIDPSTYNMSPDCLAAKLEEAASSGSLPKVIIPVHLAGQPCDMERIHALACEYGVAVIEDASHAIGASYRDEPVGNCRFSDITVFSFHPVKIVTTGEGGMALTNRDDLAGTMRLDRSHGITRDAELMECENPPGYYYEQQRLGFNYRMTELQAALGLSQLNRLDTFIERRRDLADRYDAELAGLPLRLPQQMQGARSAWHLYVIRPQPGDSDLARQHVYDRLRGDGIGVNLHYIPVYRQPWYREMGFAPGYCPEAEAYYAEAISIPIFPAMTDDEQAQVISAIGRALRP